MSNLKPRPTNIVVNREQREMVITWNDGAECHYSFAGLRAICPCVTCKGGHANMGGPPDMEAFHAAADESLTMENIQTVGGYAVQFFWSDGHSTGIYNWEYLHQACPES